MRTLRLATVLGTLLLACATLTPADQTELSNDAAIIAKCEAEGRACKSDGGMGCYGRYDACMKDGGLR